MGRNNQTCYALKHKNFSQNDVERWRKSATDILETGGSKHMRDSKIAK